MLRLPQLDCRVEWPVRVSEHGAREEDEVCVGDAEDGVKDGLISDPSVCHFDYAALECAGADADTCLTAAQVRFFGQ